MSATYVGNMTINADDSESEIRKEVEEWLENHIEDIKLYTGYSDEAWEEMDRNRGTMNHSTIAPHIERGGELIGWFEEDLCGMTDISDYMNGDDGSEDYDLDEDWEQAEEAARRYVAEGIAEKVMDRIREMVAEHDLKQKLSHTGM